MGTSSHCYSLLHFATTCYSVTICAALVTADTGSAFVLQVTGSNEWELLPTATGEVTRSLQPAEIFMISTKVGSSSG